MATIYIVNFCEWDVSYSKQKSESVQYWNLIEINLCIMNVFVIFQGTDSSLAVSFPSWSNYYLIVINLTHEQLVLITPRFHENN